MHSLTGISNINSASQYITAWEAFLIFQIMQLQTTTALKGQSSGNYKFLSIIKPFHLHSLAGFKYQLSASQYITAWEASLTFPDYAASDYYCPKGSV